jgi:hypothetical protein
MPIVLNGTTGITTPTYNGNTTAEYLVPVTGFKNRIINGRMQISQRGTSFTGISTDGPYTVDRFQYAMNGGGAVSSSQSSTSPAGFSNSLLTTVTTADGTVASSSYYQVRQNIEGFNIADLNWGTANSKTVTVSFWVNCSVLGTYTFTLRNAGGAVSYVTTYSIPVANTWTYITITVPGPTIGTWGSTNDTGIFATWDLGTGSTSVTSSTNTWIAGNFTGATGATKLINTNGATFYLTGVQLELGSTATSFDYRPYGTELALCQRYYYKLAIGQGNSRALSGYISSTTQSINLLNMPVSMRTSPTALETSGTAAHYSVAYTNTETTCSAVPSYNDASFNTVSVIGPVASGLTPGQGCQLRYINASAYLAVSAEL